MNGLLHVSSSPHARSKVTTDKIMFAVLLALAPAACVGIWNFGLRALLLIVISMAVCPLTEYLYEKGMKKPVTIADGSALVTGLLLAMNMPVQAPLWMPVIGGVFAILVVKQLFGGLGQNIMNPALAGRCFLLISFPGHMTNFAAPAAAHLVDTVSGATPLAAAKAGEQVNLLSMFLGNTTGTIGETSALALLLGGIFLVCIHVIDLNIPLIYIGTELLFALIFGGHGFDINFLGAHLFGGGLMLGAWFMATDYVTRPITKKGQYIYAVILGLLTGVFRIFGNSAEGVSYAIIFTNLMVPLIERQRQEESMNKIVKNALILAAITLIAGLLLGAAHQVTLEPIQKQQEKEKQESCQNVFPEAVSFEEVTMSDAEQAELTAALIGHGFEAQTIDELLLAKDASGATIGLVEIISTTEGYGGGMQFSMGIASDGTTKGISFLSLSETAGLGMRADTDDFKNQFKDKNVEAFSYTKSGASADDEIDALSGATLTTNAVTNGVNAGICCFNYCNESGLLSGEGGNS